MNIERELFRIDDLIQLIISKFKFIFLFSLLISSAIVFVTFLIPKTYTSSILVKNNFNQASSSLRSLSNQFGGLASMAGIDIDSTGSLTLEQIEAQIVSRDFIDHLASFEDEIFFNVCKHNMGFYENINGEKANFPAEDMQPHTWKITKAYLDWVEEINKSKRSKSKIF